LRWIASRMRTKMKRRSTPQQFGFQPRSKNFVALLANIVINQPHGRGIHVIVDNRPAGR